MNSSQGPDWVGLTPERQASLLESTAQIGQISLVVWATMLVYGVVVFPMTCLALRSQWKNDAKQATVKRTLIILVIEGFAIMLFGVMETASSVEIFCSNFYANIVPITPLIHQTASFAMFYERAKCTEKFWTKCQRFTSYFIWVLMFANIGLTGIVASSLTAQMSPLGNCSFRLSNPGIAIIIMFVQVLLLSLTLALFLLPLLSMNKTGKKLDDRLKKTVKRNLKLFVGSLIFPIVFFFYTSSTNGRAATTPPWSPEFWDVLISLQWTPMLQGLDTIARSVCIRIMTNIWLPKTCRKRIGSQSGTRRSTHQPTSIVAKSSAVHPTSQN